MIVHLPLFQTNHTAENIASVNTFKHIKGFFFPMMLHFCAQLFYPIIRSRFLKNSFWVMPWWGTKYVNIFCFKQVRQIYKNIELMTKSDSLNFKFQTTFICFSFVK